MSLYYLVKLEMLIAHMLPLSCYKRKHQNLSRLNCGRRIRKIWIQLIIACANVARKGVQNTHHCSWAIDDDTDEWLPQWRHTPALGLIGPLCSQSLFQFVQISDTCFVHILLVFTCCNYLASNLANLEATVKVG